MYFELMIPALVLGIRHAFEPDHMAAVSVLATRQQSLLKGISSVLWRSSQWALGHGFTLILLSVTALLLKSSFPKTISSFVEVWVIGPMMIYLGIVAIYRAFRPISHTHSHTHNGHEHSHKHSHDVAGHSEHVHADAEAAIKSTSGRAFGVGMLHGMAGTGGALAAIPLAIDNTAGALFFLAIESIGVLLAMLVVSVLLIIAVKVFAAKSKPLLMGLNIVIGIFSIAVGCLWVYRNLIIA